MKQSIKDYLQEITSRDLKQAEEAARKAEEDAAAEAAKAMDEAESE